MTPGKLTTASFATKTMQPKVFEPMMPSERNVEGEKICLIKIRITQTAMTYSLAPQSS